jgi:hypothetical protein
MDTGPVSLVYYSVCAVPGAVTGLLVAVSSAYGASRKLIVTAVGALGGVAGGALVGTVPTPPPGKGSDILPVVALILFTAFCGWLSAFVAARLFRRKAG